MSTIVIDSGSNRFQSNPIIFYTDVWGSMELSRDILSKIEEAAHRTWPSVHTLPNDSIEHDEYQQIAQILEGHSAKAERTGLPRDLHAQIFGIADNNTDRKVPFRRTSLYGWSDEEIALHLNYIKQKFLRVEAEEVLPKTWWPADAMSTHDNTAPLLLWSEIENSNPSDCGKVLHIAEELVRRGADVADLFVAFKASHTSYIQGILAYIDYRQARDQWPKNSLRKNKEEYPDLHLKEQHFRQAYHMAKEDWYVVQVHAQTEALSLNPYLPGATTEAIHRIYQQGLKQFPKSAALLTCYAEFLEGYGDSIHEALRYSEHALDIDANYALAYNVQGNVMLRLGEIKSAIDLFFHGIRLDPYFAVLHRNLGRACVAAQEWEQARASYDRAIELDPDAALTYALRGDLTLQTAQWEDALSDFRLAVDIEPEEPLFQYRLGNILCHFEDFEGAIDAYNMACKLKPDFIPIYINLCSALCEVGRLSEAIKIAERSINMDPKNAFANYNLACAYALSGILNEARFYLLQAIDLHPSLEKRAQKDKDLEKVIHSEVGRHKKR